MERHKQRYVIDLTYLLHELCTNKKAKYLLNICAHFSKFVISYPINKKSSNVITDKLKKCFEIFGKPEQNGTDNGSEFVNKKVKKLLSENKFQFVHGKPYNPHSNGVVERVNRTIKNLLICKYLENIKNFDLVNSLKNLINVINNSKHRTTKNIPKDIFYSIVEELFKIVKFNTINSSKNYKSELIELKENDNITIQSFN